MKVPKAAELIARAIRGRIIKQNLAPGAPLPSEADLCVEYDVSRPTLREAFRILEMQGMVRVVRGARGGGRVTLPERRMVAEHGAVYLQAHRTTVADLHEARTAIEPRIVGRLATSLTAAQLRKLRDCLAGQRAALDDPMGFWEADTRFHELFVEFSANQTLGLILSILHELLRSHDRFLLQKVTLQLGNVTKSYKKNLAAKERLLEHLQARDAEAAELLWQKHLEAQAQLMTGVGRVLVDAL